MLDIIRDPMPDLSEYGLVGFAAFTDFLTPSKPYLEFVDKLPPQDGKPAFIFNTYGMITGPTLEIMDKQLADRGFRVLAGHSLHMPESFPPLIARGLSNDKAPSDKELAAFKAFVAELDRIAFRLSAGETVSAAAIDIGLGNKLMPRYPKGMPKLMMGKKSVDETLCTSCGVCAKACPAGAITMSGRPSFDEAKCVYCWGCYNRCPARAIHTKKHKGGAQYTGPSARLREKLK